MKTDDLISALTQDLPTRPLSPLRAVGLALLISVPIAFGILYYALVVRPDFWIALGHPRFAFKFVFTLTALAGGLWLALRLSRPGTDAGPARAVVVLALLLLASAVGLELFALPRSDWLAALLGDRALACMLLIPTLSAAPLAALLYTMRSGAPDDPATAGTAVGLLAGAVGATLYASHCPNDSPLFVATWYLIGIGAVTFAGRVIGARVLRW